MDLSTGVQPIILKISQDKQFKLSPEDMKALEDKRLRKKCFEFESILFYSMLKTMRKTIQKTGFLYGGNAEEIYTSMLDQEYAKEISKITKTGLAESLYNQLSREGV